MLISTRLHTLALALVLGLALAAGSAAAQIPGLPGAGVGMQPVRSTVMIDKAATAGQRKAILARIDAAAAKVHKTFGGRLAARPMWQVCVTEACDRANGITSRAMTYSYLVLQIGSRAFKDPVTYVHERVHVELHKAEGLFSQGRLPNWFDEGLATVISRSVGYPKDRRQCAQYRDWPLPKTRAEWVRLSKSNGGGAGPVYTAASCAVLRWMDKGNRPVDALADLRAGRRLP